MLEAFVNFICAFLLAIVGFYIINKIINESEKLDFKKIIILIISSILVTLVHYLDYSSLNPLINFIINIVTYKIVFRKSISESIVFTAILSLLILVADMIFVIIQIIIIPIDQIKTNVYIYLASNIGVALIAILLHKIPITRKITNKFYQVLLSKNLKLNILFIIMLIIANCGVVYYVITNYQFNMSLFSNMLIIGSLLLLSIIFINNKDNYNKLANEYDVLLSNVQTFEEWIEKEQFARHEYKNQLAVIYSLSKETKVKNKIQEIINQNIKITEEEIYSLKSLPKGGIKGILYYKVIIAQKNKIKLMIDVSIKEKGILHRLNNKKMNELSKLIGIYFDNAIEASIESKKKSISLEIYELKDKINIVLSNTYNKSSLLTNNEKKGISSKGIGRGNGLYFASKILKNNKWIVERHEIIDNYYVETITIEKSTSI